MVKQPGWRDCERTGKETAGGEEIVPECEALLSQQAKGRSPSASLRVDKGLAIVQSL